MDTQTPGPAGIARSRLEHLASLGRRYAEAEVSYHQTKTELWAEIANRVADLQDELPELIAVVDGLIKDLATGGGIAGVHGGIVENLDQFFKDLKAAGGHDCGHDHDPPAPAEPVTAADAVELGARQAAEELLSAADLADIGQSLEDARHQLLDPPDDSATPATARVPTLRMPAIGTPQDRVLQALFKAHVDDNGRNGVGGIRSLTWLQDMTGLNPMTLLKALTNQVKAGKAVKVDDTNYRFAG